jgi:hypothetical protein
MNMPVVEVALGLAMVYLLMAILCSSLMEMVSGFLDLRGEMLWKGIESMLGGRGAGGFVDRVKGIANAARNNVVSGAPSTAAPEAAPQVRSLSSALLAHPVVDAVRSGERTPAYLTSGQFATALLDTLSNTYQTGLRIQSDITSTVRAMPEGPLKTNLELILKDAGGDAALAKERIQKWYDETMARVSGWYKRQTQWLLLVLGLVAAAALNVDTIELSRRMWTDPALRAVAQKSAEAFAAKGEHALNGGDASKRAENAKKELDALGVASMPIGWPAKWQKAEYAGWDKVLAVLCGLLGWVLTALAISLGAPYWYDLLLKLLPMARSSGARPTSDTPGAGTPPLQSVGAQPSGTPPASRPAAPAPTPTAATRPAMPFQNALNAYEQSLLEGDVREIQEELGLTGAAITGNLDQATRDAIVAAQKARGMAENGELNSLMVGELLRRRRTR